MYHANYTYISMKVMTTCAPCSLVPAIQVQRILVKNTYLEHYSGTPLNGHPSTADICDLTDNSECPDCISIDFNTTTDTLLFRRADTYLGPI